MKSNDQIFNGLFMQLIGLNTTTLNVPQGSHRFSTNQLHISKYILVSNAILAFGKLYTVVNCG